MTRLCICQICTCGRHHCPRKHVSETIPRDKNTKEYGTENRRAYDHKGKSVKVPAWRPKSEIGMPTGRMLKTSTHTDAYTPKKLPPKFVRTADTYKPPESKMYGTSTYRKDYDLRAMPERDKPFRLKENIVIPPDRMESRTTQNRAFVSWDRKVTDECRGQPVRPVENAIMAFGQEFMGQSESRRTYKKHPFMGRVMGGKKPDNIHVGQGRFEATGTYAHDFPPRKIEVRESCKPKPGSKFWPEDLIKSVTTYKTDFKSHDSDSRRKPCGPKECQFKPPNEPFKGNSSYKTDFTPHRMAPREDLPWAQRNQYKSPDVPFSGNTTYRKDFPCPPEDLEPVKGKPLRCSLTVGNEEMAKTTTHRLDYTYAPGHKPAESVKVMDVFKPPSEPFRGESTTRRDYVRHGEAVRTKPAMQTDNLYVGGDRMDMVTTNKLDFRCAKIECPVVKLQMGDQETLSQYKFVESTRDHEYYSKARPKKKLNSA